MSLSLPGLAGSITANHILASQCGHARFSSGLIGRSLNSKYATLLSVNTAIPAQLAWAADSLRMEM
ncbi:MAG TPA: hypothetical protein VH684_15090, partial [Xanthobacteraceae bacterium]